MGARRLVYAVVVVLVLVSPGFSQEVQQPHTSTFNQLWLEAVVSIECIGCGAAQGQASQAAELFPIGTGFLLRTARDHVLLVTAKHVALAPRPQKSRVAYRLNTPPSGSIVLWDDELQKDGLGPWHFSNDADLACRFLAWPAGSKIVTITLADLLPSDRLSAGAPALVLGFPLGLRAPDHSRPIARRGMVARADRERLLVDAFVFPGNSGGPVVYTPPFKVGKGLLSPFVPEEKLIGVISSFIPYNERAISEKTGLVRIMFQENSGIAEAVPAERVLELVNGTAVSALDASFP